MITCGICFVHCLYDKLCHCAFLRSIIKTFILHWFYLTNEIALIGYFLLCTVTDQEIVFLLPGPCRVMVRNDNSISADFQRTSSKTIRTTHVSALVRQFGSALGFLTLQDKYNIYEHCRRI